MNLHDRHPKNAVREFLQRYAGRDPTRDDSYYTVAEGHSGFQAKLHVAVWSNHVFEGEIYGTQKEYEISAAACFLKDPAVVEAARLLPPPLKVIKFWTKFNEAGDQTIPGKRHRFDPNDIRHPTISRGTKSNNFHNRLLINGNHCYNQNILTCF